MNELLTITKGPDAWYLTAERHIELFGTATIPTPFTPAADAQTVFNAIHKSNPGAKIVVVQD